MKPKPIYNKNGHVLGTCNECGAVNYVEPHGISTFCKKCKKHTDHSNIPYEKRDIFNNYMIHKK